MRELSFEILRKHPAESLKSIYEKTIVATENSDFLPPEYQKMKNSLTRERKKCLPSVPQKTLEVTIDGSWALSQHNEKFWMDLNADVGEAIFATKKALENFLKTDTFICDSTFKTAPRPFDRTYTFFAVFGRAKNSRVMGVF